ncbi:hypothetical protein Tco_1291178, partial [Tanacetum coccineum]
PDENSLQAMMNYTMTTYNSTPRSNRSKGIVVKHLLQFALFASTSQLTNAKISNFLGSAGFLQSTPITLTLDDVTNPLEEGEIPRYSKGIEEVEFRIKAEYLKQVNDDNTAGRIKQAKCWSYLFLFSSE